MEKKLYRNEIVDARMVEIDRRFAEFERELHKQGVGLGIGTDWLLLAITAATATIGAGSTKVAFGAISTGIVGAKASFDKHALINQALPTLVAQMVAQRESIRATIRGSQDLPVDSYTLYAGLSDLGRFERAGSIPGSLQSIAEDAGQKAATARQQLRDVRTAKFIKTTAGDLLRKFWKPDGKTINTENKGKLEAWMKKNLIATAPGSITMFLRSEVLEDARIQAVKELGLVKEQ